MLNSFPSKYRYLFFDLDNTLWDFKTNSDLTIRELINKYLPGIKLDIGAFMKVYNQVNDELWLQYRNGETSKATLRSTRFPRAFAEFRIFNTEAIDHISEGYLSESPVKTGLFPYSHEILQYLKNKGYKLFLLTNGFSEVQNLKIKHCQLEPYFEAMYTSEQSGYQKPNRKAFEYAVKSANARKELSLMIGDDEEADIAGAKVFGIDQVWFNPEKKPNSVNPTYVIESLLELKLIL